MKEPTAATSQQVTAPYVSGATEEKLPSYAKDRSENEEDMSFMDKLRTKTKEKADNIAQLVGKNPSVEPKEDDTIPEQQQPNQVASDGAVTEARVPEDLAQSVAKTAPAAAPMSL